MHGRALPPLPELLARLLVVSAIVVAPLLLWQESIVQPLLGIFSREVRLVAPEFTINSAEITRRQPSQVVRFRANLSVPLEYGEQTIYPFGWNGTPQGGFEVSLSLSGLFDYPAMLLIVALAWPTHSAGELGLRLIFSAVAVSALVMMETPITVAAELCNSLRGHFNLQGRCGWMVVSRFLMGGGGFALALLLATVVIVASRQLPAQSRSR
jgi:hypothetical protein